MSASPPPSRENTPGDPAADPEQRAPGADAPTGSTAVPTGSHRTDRTSGGSPETSGGSHELSEERSAAILLGEQSGSPYQSDPYTTVTPGSGTGSGTEGPDADAENADRERDGSGPAEDRGDEPDTGVLLDGATETRPHSRTGAHLWSVLLTLVLIPVAWYLLADAGARLTLPDGNPWDTGELNPAALIELAVGLVVLAVALLAARWSSIGAIVTGVLVLLLGLPFVAVPGRTADVLTSVTDRLASLGDFGSNIAHHLEATGSTGRFVVYGVALLLLGVVSHGARRQGRREAGIAARARRR